MKTTTTWAHIEGSDIGHFDMSSAISDYLSFTLYATEEEAEKARAQAIAQDYDPDIHGEDDCSGDTEAMLLALQDSHFEGFYVSLVMELAMPAQP